MTDAAVDPDAARAQLRAVADKAHRWVPSTLGHGDYMCSKCVMTTREWEAIGNPDCTVPA